MNPTDKMIEDEIAAAIAARPKLAAPGPRPTALAKAGGLQLFEASKGGPKKSLGTKNAMKALKSATKIFKSIFDFKQAIKKMEDDIFIIETGGPARDDAAAIHKRLRLAKSKVDEAEKELGDLHAEVKGMIQKLEAHDKKWG